MLSALAWAVLPFALHAQEWPARNVTILVPFAAGGTVDIVVLDNVIYGEPKKAF